MLTTLFAMALQASTPTIIYVDNRQVCSDASSRIAEGNRRRARIRAERIAADLNKQGQTTRIITLESTGDAGFRLNNLDTTLLVRVDNGVC